MWRWAAAVPSKTVSIDQRYQGCYGELAVGRGQ
jgi:hypothetical protein